MASQTKIKSISIENVRGISSAKFIFDTPEMLGNKFHLLVAPNGFGKSSFAGAFSSLKPRSLKLPFSLLHKEDEANNPKLEIAYSVDGVDYTVRADGEGNDISKIFSVAVINSKLKPRAVAKTGFQQFAKATASLIIEPIVLVEKIPVRPGKSFVTTEFKKTFGPSGKILSNIQPFLDNDLLLRSILSLPDIGRFSKKAIWKELDPIISDINAQTGTIDQIVTWVGENKLSALRGIPALSAIAALLTDFQNLSEVSRYLIAYQFALAYKEDAKLLRDHLAWRTYLSGKKRCEELLKSVNSNPAWIAVHIKETKGKLVAEFPEATKMSNGQRDLLSFVAQLMKAEFQLSGVRAILIIDELFDYLDECNLLAAQFYASRFIEKFKATGAEIFPLFLTHLNPDVFKHSALGLGKKDLRKVHFLDKASDSSRRVGIAAMVKLRDEADLKPYIGKYFFHYHPQNCDQEAVFKTHGLKASWGKSHNFYSYVFEEFVKYRLGEGEADFVAACVAARIAIEKHAFDQVKAADQTRFTDEFSKGTSEKLDFVAQLGCTVPESHRLLGLLYNDILHHKDNFDYISAIVSKMKNPAIRGMMSEIPMPSFSDG
ncbi:hypothetical protein [Achromobacter sp.]|uniref:hypothetical protein n=1 Tax=Achromobacter sp. TaxID=134375 RepID=UPI00289F9212|nr:hypothetical protein [Achromobacter sp.]